MQGHKNWLCKVKRLLMENLTSGRHSPILLEVLGVGYRCMAEGEIHKGDKGAMSIIKRQRVVNLCSMIASSIMVVKSRFRWRTLQICGTCLGHDLKRCQEIALQEIVQRAQFS